MPTFWRFSARENFGTGIRSGGILFGGPGIPSGEGGEVLVRGKSCQLFRIIWYLYGAIMLLLLKLLLITVSSN